MHVVAAVVFQLIPKQRTAADESKSRSGVAQPGPPIYAQAANAAETDGHISPRLSPASLLLATMATVESPDPHSGQPAGSAWPGRATGGRVIPRIHKYHSDGEDCARQKQQLLTGPGMRKYLRVLQKACSEQPRSDEPNDATCPAATFLGTGCCLESYWDSIVTLLSTSLSIHVDTYLRMLRLRCSVASSRTVARVWTVNCMPEADSF
jgi:hypothetical protein